METIKKLYQVRGSGFGVVVSLPGTDEEKAAGYGSVSFDTQVWGQAPTWDDIIAALYWGDENIGERLESVATDTHRARTAPWRVETHTGMSGRVNYLVRVRDEAAEKYGTAGKITTSLHISCAGKLNRGIPAMRLADWYVLLKTVPSLSWEEIEKEYENHPPRELRPIEGAEWNAPGAEPWDEDAPAPDEEPAQEESEGKDYTQEKYEILRSPEYAHPDNPNAYRIRALRDIPAWNVKAGDLGGYVESEKNLDQYGLCWVQDDAQVCDSARVWGDARVFGNARVCDYAQVFSRAQVGDNAQVCGYSRIGGDASIYGDAQVGDEARINNKAQVGNHARLQKEQDSITVGVGEVYATFYRTDTGVSVVSRDIFAETLEDPIESCDVSPKEYELIVQLVERYVLET